MLRVKEWNSDTYKLEVSIVDGSFTNGERITGNESGAVYVLSSTSEFDEVSKNMQTTIRLKQKLIRLSIFQKQTHLGCPE